MSETERLRESLSLVERAREDEQVRRLQSDRMVDALLRFAERGSPEQAYTHITAAFRAALAADEAVLLDTDRKEASRPLSATAARLQSASLRISSRFHRVLSQRKPSAYFDVSQIPEWAEQPESVRADTASMLLVPLCGEGFTLLLLLLHGQRAYFTADHVGLARRLMQPACNSISHALSEAAERQLRETVEKQRDQLHAEIEGRARLEIELQQTREAILRRELAEKAAIIEHQHAAIRQLATPIIEVGAGILCLPLIGFLDVERSQQISQTLLAAVQDYRAGAVIIDITGITQIDAHSMGHFLRMAGAVRLLGTRCAITGISASVATQLVGMGTDASRLLTYPRVRDAIQQLLQGAVR